MNAAQVDQLIGLLVGGVIVCAVRFIVIWRNQ